MVILLVALVIGLFVVAEDAVEDAENLRLMLAVFAGFREKSRGLSESRLVHGHGRHCHALLRRVRASTVTFIRERMRLVVVLVGLWSKTVRIVRASRRYRGAG